MSTPASGWLVVLIYYLMATFLPIDKIIGKLYPMFGACLIIMALGHRCGVMLVQTAATVPPCPRCGSMWAWLAWAIPDGTAHVGP